MNRQQFLQSLLAASSTAAVPGVALDTLVNDAILRGVVENQTFYVRETLRIVDVGVVVRNCQFIAMPELGDDPIIRVESEQNVVHSCRFQGNGDRYLTVIAFQQGSVGFSDGGVA